MGVGSGSDEETVARVTSTALGLAFEGREDAAALRAVLTAAEGEDGNLRAARRRIAELEVVDTATRQRADALLYVAVAHGHRLELTPPPGEVASGS